MAVDCRNRRGSVLLVVMWLSVILGITAAALAYGRRVEMRVVRNDLDSGQAAAVARGGVEFVISGLREHGLDKSHTPAMEWWSAKSRYEKVEVGDGSCAVFPRFDSSGAGASGDAYGLADEECKLNVNNATEEMLSKLPGLSEDLARAIVRRRTELSGGKTKKSLVTTLAESREKKKEEQKPLLNTPFSSLDDLMSVSGLNDKVLYGNGRDDQGLSKYLTASSSGRVNVNSAPKEVILALGVKDDAFKTVDSKRTGGKGFETTDNFLEVSGLLAELTGGDDSGSETQNEKLDALKELLAVRSANFRCVSVGRAAGGARLAVYATLCVDKEAIKVASWRQERLSPESAAAGAGGDGKQASGGNDL